MRIVYAYCYAFLVGLGFISCSKEYLLKENKNQLISTKKQEIDFVAIGENAAPSMHLNQYFTGNSILKMQKIKITQTAFAEYFEVNNFSGGYSGLQHTNDSSSVGGSISKTLIASLWDPNTSANIHAVADYVGLRTVYSRFGGEGDGAKTLNPYGWKVNNWYNVVHRSWKSGDSIFIANFIQDVNSGIWFHTSTLSAKGSTALLGDNDDSFIENWISGDQNMNGNLPRKAYFKDCWILTPSYTWLKPVSRHININTGAADSARNGVYNSSFDGNYDAMEDAYYMAHGNGIVPSAIFNGQRNATITAIQQSQGATPILGSNSITQVNSTYSNGIININWNISTTNNPQLIANVSILNSSNLIVASKIDTVPQERTMTINKSLLDGDYTVKIVVTDIFNSNSTPLTNTFNSTTGISNNSIYELKPSNALGRNLDIDYSGTTNGSNVSVYTDTNNPNQRWLLVSTGDGYYKILSKNAPSKALNIANNSNLVGANVEIYEYSGATAQKWKFTKVSNGNFKIQPANSTTLCLASASVNDDNANVVVNNYTGLASQLWKLELINN